MNLLISVIIAGCAVGFSTELFGAFLERFTSWYVPIIKQTLAAPLGALFAWLLGVTGWPLLVVALASAFITLSIMAIINRPINIQQVISRNSR
jgi:hypothetical protein